MKFTFDQKGELMSLGLIFVLLFIQVSNSFTKDGKRSIHDTRTAKVYVVTDNSDESDPDPFDDTFEPATLRSAIENANFNPGIDTIKVEIFELTLQSGLPLITEGVIIDGNDSFGRPEIDGDNTWGTAFHLLDADGTEIRNIAFGNFSGTPIIIESDFVLIENCYIGTFNGIETAPNSGAGILITGQDNQVFQSLISNSGGNGISINAPNGSLTAIDQSIIGLDETGTELMGNAGHGIEVISGSVLIYDNTITANIEDGIYMRGTANGQTSYIVGNFIGTDTSGVTGIGNGGNGITLQQDSVFVDSNLVSFNKRGLSLEGDNYTIRYNNIGTDRSGTINLGNEDEGIYSNGNNHIIGAQFGLGNLISGNGREGIRVRGDSITIVGNIIGTDSDGDTAVPNLNEGIEISTNSSNHIIENNLISGNSREGIRLFSNNYNVKIIGNKIGSNIDGNGIISNGRSGILIAEGDSILIGETGSEFSNLIVGNGQDGIRIERSIDNPITQYSYRIVNNDIGFNPSNNLILGNQESGIELDEVQFALIGGSSMAEGNNILFNSNEGILINDTRPTTNEITPDSNYISNNGLGVLVNFQPINNFVVNNQDYGIRIRGGSGNNIIDNWISLNSKDGIVATGGQGNFFNDNRFVANGELAIDLDSDEVDINDSIDSDTGPNGILNYPEIDDVVFDETMDDYILTYSYNGQPNSEKFFYVYLNNECDDSGYGEGLESSSFFGPYLLDNEGNFQFTDTLGVDTSIWGTDFYVTMTAYDYDYGSSEFSECVQVRSQGDVMLADLEIEKSDGLEIIEITDVFPNTTYEIKIKNIGSATATNIAVRDTVPGISTLETFLESWSLETAGNIDVLEDSIVIATVSTLAPGDSFFVSIEIKFSLSTREGFFSNTAYVTTASQESRLDNNQSSDVNEVEINPLSNEDESELITEYLLYQNYPNPFNPGTQINYYLPKSGHIELAVFDIRGSKVTELVNTVQNSGNHSIYFDASGLSSGIYFYRLTSDSEVIVMKMTLIN